MQRKIYTVEELMLDDSFLSYCLDTNAPHKSFWDKETELHIDQKAIFDEAKYTILLLHGKLDDYEIREEIEKVKKLVSSPEEKKPAMETPSTPGSHPYSVVGPYPNQQPRKYFRRTYFIYGIAALLLVFIGGYLFRYSVPKATVTPVNTADIFYSSGIGERKSIRLPDGSVAVLNSNSSISLPGDFNLRERSVILKGEAFFRVTKNPLKAFIVHSGSFSVTALGTSFYVHAREKGPGYKVDLLEGKVQLASTGNTESNDGPFQTTLLPGEQGAWASSKMTFEKAFIDSVDLKKWIGGRLSFKDMEVEKVMELLEQWYGVDIIVKHKKWSRLTLTGDYDNKPLDHVLKIICFSLSAGYTYLDNQVIIK